MMNEINITMFCGGESRWPKPWILAGKECATDGRIAVRIQTDEPDAVSGHGKPRSFNDVCSWAFDGPLVTWPDIVPPAPDEPQTACLTCGGTKVTTILCERCEGEGQTHCANTCCSGSHPCPDCNGEGVIWDKDKPCEECNGTGQLLYPESVMICGRKIAGNYAHKISLLPNAKAVNFGKPNDILKFVFDGGEGLVMPLKQEGVSNES